MAKEKGIRGKGNGYLGAIVLEKKDGNFKDGQK
jgi:hypothetical protein